jgi:hypothetical protein
MVWTLVVVAAARVVVRRGTLRQEQADEYAAREEQGDAYDGIPVGDAVVWRLWNVPPGRTCNA